MVTPVTHVEESSILTYEGWNVPATVDDALLALKGFHPTWLALAKKAPEVTVHIVTQRPPRSQLTRGKVVAIGDTVHHMLPTYAQGGASAIEDAAALGILLSNITPTTSLTTRLHLFQQMRIPRSATTQLLSSTNSYISMEGLAEKIAEIRKFYAGPLPPGPECPPFSEPIREFFYGYDAIEEAEKTLKWEGKEGGVPEGELKFFGDVEGAKWTLGDGVVVIV